MARPTLSSYLRDHLDHVGKKKEPGPFVTISRQYGCDGAEVGQALVERLNARSEDDPDKQWRVYERQFLRQLAEDTGYSEEQLERERLTRPSILKDIYRGIRHSSVPDGFEIRTKVAQMIRTAAFDGYAVIIGHGGAAATVDLSNGLNVRLEAPKDWRIARVAARENLTRQGALGVIDSIEKRRRFVRRLYQQQSRGGGFHLSIDNAVFDAEQIADLLVRAMEDKGLVERE